MRLRWTLRRHATFLFSFWRWFVLAFFVISVYLVLHLSSEQSSADLEHEISRLSVYYVRALAREKKLHPRANMDVVDLQKTMSMLLHTMLQRVNSVENVVARNLSANAAPLPDDHALRPPVPPSVPSHSIRLPSLDTSITIRRSVKEDQRLFNAFVNYNRMKTVMARVGKNCKLPSDWSASYPECESKLEWMTQFYTSDPCYAHYGVDGSHCSGVIYLSEVENFCPRSPEANIRPVARSRPELGVLPAILASAPNDVLARVQLMWPAWRTVGKLRETLKHHVNGSSLRIALIPFGIKEAADQEMVTMMWADLASALHLLGHDIIWVQSMDRLNTLQQRFPGKNDARSPCQARVTLFLDLIFTDDRGLEAMKKTLKETFNRVACIVRVIRETGLVPTLTRPPENFVWRQFWTPYPTFDDHTFLGFALAESGEMDDKGRIRAVISLFLPSDRRRLALVIGSDPELFRGAGPYLAAVADVFPLHTMLDSATDRSKVAKLLSPHVPEFTNHRITSDYLQRLTSLVSSAAVVVGLGKPFDPALALLAISQGAIFLNPTFDTPRMVLGNVSSSLSDKDWKVNSQHTYLERFLKEPHVFSVPIDRPMDLPPLLNRVYKLLDKATPHVPYAFSHVGYLERLTFFLRTQDLCVSNLTPLEPALPPPTAVEFYLSVKGDSCEKTCARKNRVCEPSFFPVINSRSELQERSIECQSSYFQPHAAFPAFAPNNKICYFQSDPICYSCFRAPSSRKMLRICPCRDHRPGQTSLCKNCL